METDVRFAAVSRKPAFTIRVPTADFADDHAAGGTGVLITQQIAFGENGIEPHRAKCLDHELADSLPYYRDADSRRVGAAAPRDRRTRRGDPVRQDRKSTRLNSSH